MLFDISFPLPSFLSQAKMRRAREGSQSKDINTRLVNVRDSLSVDLRCIGPLDVSVSSAVSPITSSISRFSLCCCEFTGVARLCLLEISLFYDSGQFYDEKKKNQDYYKMNQQFTPTSFTRSFNLMNEYKWYVECSYLFNNKHEVHWMSYQVIK